MSDPILAALILNGGKWRALYSPDGREWSPCDPATLGGCRISDAVSGMPFGVPGRQGFFRLVAAQ